MGSVTKILHDIVVGRRGLAKKVSKSLGKPYPTLLRELNPWDKGAKVGVDDLVDIMRAAEDVTPLKIMAESLGYRIEPK
jgi:hypothetical protein